MNYSPASESFPSQYKYLWIGISLIKFNNLFSSFSWFSFSIVLYFYPLKLYKQDVTQIQVEFDIYDLIVAVPEEKYVFVVFVVTIYDVFENVDGAVVGIITIKGIYTLEL